MTVISTLRNIASYARISFERPAAGLYRPAPPPAASNRSELLEARTRLLNLYRALEAVSASLNVPTKRFQLDLPDAQSSSSLGLSLSESAAFLASNGEINASPHSFSTFGPDWSGASTALITIGGEYNGSDGTGALSFEVRNDGIRGVNSLRIRVTDPSSNRDDYRIFASDPLDTRYDLQNGLFFTLGNGALVRNDTTSVQLFQNVPSAVDPDKPLAGVRNDNPNFQYYEAPNTLPPVVDGSFDINGVNIAVSTTDTINTVVDRVNQSAAGVTAVFNPVTERIEFTQDSVGSVPTVDIQNDTSNFSIATKLSTASVTPGIDSDINADFEDVAAFSGVQAGTALVNGVAISVDPSVDSLSDVIDRVNQSTANVSASFDPVSQLVTIEATQQESVLEIDGNGTGLFAALRMPEGRVDPEARSGGISKFQSYRISEAFAALSGELNAVFDDRSFSDGSASVSSARRSFSALLNATIQNSGGNGDSLFGLRIDQSSASSGNGRALDFDLLEFARNLQIRGDTVKDVLVGAGENDGLIGKLFQVTLQSLRKINQGLGISGSVVDTLA